METRTGVLAAARTGSRSEQKDVKSSLGSFPLPRGLRRGPPAGGWSSVSRLAVVTSALLIVGLIATPARAYAAEATVGLGTAASFSVLGGQTVTNTGPTTLSGDLGVSPGTAITGFPPGKASGATYKADAVSSKAESDLVIGYNDAAGRAETSSVAGDLVGKTLTAGVYKSTGPIALSGTLTLNGQGNPNAVFIFQAASTLITASASKVSVINGAQACNVFWQVGSSATLGTASSFTGTIMALTSITVTTDTTVAGRALARNGSVTLDDDTFTSPACKTTSPPPTTTTTTTASTTSTTTTTGSSTSTTSPTGSGGVGGTTGSGFTGKSGSGSGPTGTNTSGLALTGASPLLMPMLGVGLLMLLLGGLFLAAGRPWARSRRFRHEPE
jgi:hypothetical protein